LRRTCFEAISKFESRPLREFAPEIKFHAQARNMRDAGKTGLQMPFEGVRIIEQVRGNTLINRIKISLEK
jgi:hypothetical protein